MYFYAEGGTPTPYKGEHWRHLANTTEPSVCGGDAVLSNYFDHLLLLLDSIVRTTHVDAVHCYRPSSVVCRSVDLSVCHSSEP